MTQGGAVALVLDEHLLAIAPGLRARGLDARTVEDFRARSTLDPDVIRAVAAAMGGPWVLLTMDGTIVTEYPGFEWDRYAIAWIVIDAHLRGASVEHAKTDVVHRHAHRMLEQRPGDHFTYTQRARYQHPPSLLTRDRR